MQEGSTRGGDTTPDGETIDDAVRAVTEQVARRGDDAGSGNPISATPNPVIENWLVAYLHAHPREHGVGDADADAIESQVASLKAGGVLDPIVVLDDKAVVEGVARQAGVVVEGLDRLEAARRAGRRAVPCVVVDEATAERVLAGEPLRFTQVDTPSPGNAVRPAVPLSAKPSTHQCGNSAADTKDEDPKACVAASPDTVSPCIAGGPIGQPDAGGRNEAAAGLGGHDATGSPACPTSQVVDPPNAVGVRMRPLAELRDHPRAEIVPAMSDAEYDCFRDAVRAHGIRVPLLVTADCVVVNGHHRLRAARELGLGAVPCIELVVEPGEDIVEQMVGLALHRRHLTIGQKAAMALELDTYREERARAGARRRRTRIGADDPQEPLQDPVRASLPAPAPGRPRDLVAKWAGVSARTVQTVMDVWRRSPEFFAQVKAGRLTPNAAMRKLRGLDAMGALSSGAPGSDQPPDEAAAAALGVFERMFAAGSQIKTATKPVAEALGAGVSSSLLSSIAPRVAELRRTLAVASGLVRRLQAACGPSPARRGGPRSPRRRATSTDAVPDRPLVQAKRIQGRPGGETENVTTGAASARSATAEGEGAP